jgi:ATP-dependent Clp protease adaptor protein ClpS
MAQPKKKSQGDVEVLERKRTKRPKRWKVLLFNDDYTTMEFVVAVLQTVFRLSPSEATQVMLKVHTQGHGVAGVYPHDVAESKVLTVHERAQSAGYPLRAGMEEE